MAVTTKSKLSGSQLAVTGTGGDGFITLVGQSSAPTAPAAGTLLIHSSTANGFTRMEQDNEATTNIVYGRDNVFICKNESGVTINKGQVVYTSGVVSNVPQITKARANSATTLPAIGVAVDNIAHNAFGQVMNVGILYFDTSAFSDGNQVWVSTATAGALTATRPSGTTNYVQRVGTILVSNANPALGQMMVNIAPAILNMETGTNAATWTGKTVAATTIELGASATDTTLSRSAAGVVAIEGVNIPMVGTIITAPRGLGFVSNATETSYCDSIVIDPTETVPGNITPVAGTLANLWIDVYSNNINAGSTVFTLVKNGSDTTITVTVAFGVTSITGDTTHSTTVAAGDRITLKAVSTGATGSAYFSFSYQIK